MNTKMTMISLVLISLMTMGMSSGIEVDKVGEILDKTIETDFSGTYSIVDTGQTKFFDDKNEILIPPQELMPYYGQDAMYDGNQPSYQDNGDGTVTDLVTGLMWQQDPGEKMAFDEAVLGADSFDLAGYNDWRLPTIKELYSLILFSGEDVSPEAEASDDLNPFIDTDYFDFEYGDTSAGERVIDAQYASSTVYVGNSDLGQLVFGVNFADGRIKGYGTEGMGGGEKTFFILYVRGNEEYGKNKFVDNSDGTITDYATGLMWQTVDSGDGMDWEDALEYSEDLEYAGYDDWRLPNVKELQSIVDYTRSLDTHDSAAIDPIFSTTAITDEGGNENYPFFWSSTTHANMQGGAFGAYVAFGEALGFMEAPQGELPPPPEGEEPPEGDLPPPPGGEDPPEEPVEGETQLMDVHGAGAQRSDPKSGDPADYESGNGPQGDVVRIFNYVRCVRQAEFYIDDIQHIEDEPVVEQVDDESDQDNETPSDEDNTEDDQEGHDESVDTALDDGENNGTTTNENEDRSNNNSRSSTSYDHDEENTLTEPDEKNDQSEENLGVVVGVILILLFLISVIVVSIMVLKQPRKEERDIEVDLQQV